MKKATYLSLLFFVLISISCASLTRDQTNAWLSTKSAQSNINMTGTWDAGGAASGGWGTGNFIQEGNRFSGTLGMYYVDGIVSGDEVYMAISSGAKVYYTAQLKKTAEGIFTGKAVQDVIITMPGSQNAVSYLISLKKAN